MKAIGHVMILASAGAGKTYALTNRFVKLLACGAPPERIAALTFTRKAAGEFFDEILNKLAAAARDPARAARLAREIDETGLGCADFLCMLRAVTDAMHRLSLGTIDSFFARLVRNFPLELGLGGDFEILQEHAARLERRRVLRRMFLGPGTLTGAQREFIEAFKRATFGAEEKRLGRQLDEFLDQHQEIHLAAPDGDRWGNPQRIWPRGCPWFMAAGSAGQRSDRAAAALRAVLPWAACTAGQRRRWEDFLAGLDEWSPGAPLPRPVEYLLENALRVWDDLPRGAAEITVDRRRLPLAPDAGAALATVVRSIIGAELARRLEMTRGIHAVLHGYESFYHEIVRRAGRLTFADVQRLLMPETGAPRLAGERAAAADEQAAARLFIDFRLDGRLDHWLLDEFQDTSFGQWSVLRNLIDEAVQDPTGRRSFFYVGDVKQAIFAWREGDPRLFREIFEHYNRGAPGTICEQRLDRSFRSGPAVIATVNRVFGAARVLRGMFPAMAVDAWTREWRDHTSARPELGGQAALLHADDEAGRFARTLQVLREVRPLDCGLTCAVLVRTNDTGARLADYLRREGGLPALAESDLQVCVDNPLGAALLALCKAAAHPGDTLAWEHVRMTPLGDILTAEALADPDALTMRLLADLHANGFERTIEAWLRRLEPWLEPDDAFSRERGAQFAAAARLFDETGSRDVMAFIRFMESFSERETESASAVRVMTVHKAKGLGFDVVVLPELEGSRLDQRRKGLAVHKADDRSVEWILDLPPKLFHGADEVLSAHVRAAEADACYEKLSVLYVAMTRARRAMYLITEPPGDSASNNFPRLLAATLGETAGVVRIGSLSLPGSYAEGDSDWHVGLICPPARIPGDTEILSLESPAGMHRRRLPACRPSETKAGGILGTTLFSVEGGRAADFGAEVHAALATVEWWDPVVGEAWTTARRKEGMAERVVTEALECLNAPALAEVFRRPAGLAEVWRERAFEVVLDGTWVTGVFDRVVVERAAMGKAVRVAVIDFKTDRVADRSDIGPVVKRHAGQLDLYRRVAAVLTGIPPAQVTGVLVLTESRRILPVPFTS
jgi:ATP-dependent exoDNAse (exonuclease V) beta subunit